QHRVNAQNQIVGETYDTAGNLLTDPSFNTNSYVYNAENQMTEKDTTLSFYYDGDGKRVEKSSGTLYWYGADGSVLDTTNLQGVTTGTAASEYIYFGGRRIAKRDGPGDVYYYFGDHLQTVRSMAEVPQGQTTATLCFDADFYPFSGDPKLVISVCQNPNFLFTGKEHDTEDNLDYFGARYYSAQMGRFMTPDWDARPTNVPYAHFGNPQSLNLYSYVENNPTTTGDSDGHCEPVCGLVTLVSNNLSTYLAAHPDVAKAVENLPGQLAVKVALGVGGGKELGEGTKLDASAQAYLSLSATQGTGVGGQGSLSAKVLGVGVEASADVPVEKNSELVNPITNSTASVSLGADIGEKAEVSTTLGEDPTIGATVGQGVQGSVEISGFGGLIRSVGDAVMTDSVNLYHETVGNQTNNLIRQDTLSSDTDQ